MTHSTLAKLQQTLQDFLLDKTADASAITLETENFSRTERLRIYHEAYQLRLIDALRNDYPALTVFIGEEAFVKLASEFIAAHPSTHPSLRWLGQKFAAFIRASDTWKNEQPAIELATFEWAQAMAFDAADVALASIADVRALPPPQWMGMRLVFHPSVHVLLCSTNIPTLWNAIVKEEINNISAKHLPEPQSWLIWREDLQVVYRPLDNAEAACLIEFQQNKTFEEICSKLCNWFETEQVPMQAAQYLQRWLQAGLVTQILT